MSDHPGPLALSLSVTDSVFALLITPRKLVPAPRLIKTGKTNTLISSFVRSAATVGRGELPGAQSAGQDEGSDVWPLRELQRRQEGRLRGSSRSPPELRAGVRQLLEGRGEEGVFSAAQGCPSAASHLPG